MSATPINPLCQEIEGQRSYLLRYAVAKLREDDAAEEVVQETLLAALAGIESFSGESSLRTWLTAILKFKIIDWQRSQISERARLVSPTADDSEDPEWFDRLFDETGHWRAEFADWQAPDAALQQAQFFAVFERCMDKLPPTTRRVFFQREIIGNETEEICKDESISSSNCWVILHRARISLRECLERTWFGDAK